MMYDILTMGAPTAFNKKYKNGGLRRMLHQQHMSHTSESSLGPRTKLQRACCLRNEVTDLRADIMKQCEHLCDVAKTNSVADLQSAAASLAKKVGGGRLLQALDRKTTELNRKVNMVFDVHRNHEAYWGWGEGGMEVAEERDYIPITTLSPPE